MTLYIVLGILALLLLALAVLLGLSYRFVKVFLRTKPTPPEDQLAFEMGRNHLDPEVARLPYERWQLQNDRGEKLVARFYKGEKTDCVVLLNHGYNATGISMLKYLPLVLELGYSALIPDQQAQGESQGRWITYGILESRDGQGWLDEIRRRYPKAQLAVWGESMGAATSLMMAEQRPELRFCVADCPYDQAEAEVAYMAQHKGHMPGFLTPMCGLWFWILTGLSMKEAGPLRHLDELRVPTLLIHGGADHTVPVVMSRGMDQRSPAIHYWEAPGEPHAHVVAGYPEEYRQRLRTFLEQVEKGELRPCP